MYAIGSASRHEEAFTIALADTFFARFLGLMGRKDIGPIDGLLLATRGSIHTAFMRFAIDIVFLERISKTQFAVRKVDRHVTPWRARLAPKRSTHVLELSAGDAARFVNGSECLRYNENEMEGRRVQ